MNITRRWILAVPLSALVSIGCGSKDPMAPATTETEARQTATEELSRHPELVEDGLYDIQTQAQTEVSGTASAIDPLFFWRDIRRVARTFDVAFADTDSTGQPATAIVTVHKRLAGSFNIVVGDAGSEGSPTDAHVIRKPLRDHWVRRILLRRVARIDGHERRPWRVAAVSGVEVTSRDAQTRLQSLRVQSGDLDTTITNPLAFWRLRRLVQEGRLGPAHPQLAVDHGVRIVGLAHLAGADRMKNRGADQAGGLGQFLVGAVMRSRLEFLRSVFRQRL